MTAVLVVVAVAGVVGLAVGAAVTWPVGAIVAVVVALGLVPVARGSGREEQ